MKTRDLVLLFLVSLFPIGAFAQNVNDDLIAAAKKGDLTAIKSLLAKGADVNAKTRYNQTPLMFAAEKGHLEIVKFLIEAGADVNAIDTFYKFFTALYGAASKGHADVVKLLLERGARSKEQALIFGAQEGQASVVKVAIELGGLAQEALDSALSSFELSGNSEVTVGTPVVGHDLVFVTAGYPPVQPIYAIKPTATGDITLAEGKDSNDHIAWSKKRGGTYMPTPIVYGDHLYTCSNNGVLTCYDARTGERIYQERVAGQSSAFTASPIAADGKLYFTGEDGDVFVVKAGPKYELIATNPMGEVMMATPAISERMIFVRTISHVYGIAVAGATKQKAAK